MKDVTMKLSTTIAALAVGFLFVFVLHAAEDAAKNLPAGWTMEAPREEIRPLFRYQPNGGRNDREAFVIAGDNREGTSGWWQKTFDVEGGKTYSFSARRKLDSVDSGRRSGLVRVQWRDEKG